MLPKITINCAMSADGKIAKPTGEQLRISSDEDIKRMHQLRNKNDAILVGINTVLNDNPKLTVKQKYVNRVTNPIRVILDTKCRTPKDYLAVNEQAKTLIATVENCKKKYNQNVEVIQCRKNDEGLIDLKSLLNILYNEYNVRNLMVEGGGTVIWNFLKQGLCDDLYIYIAPIVIGGANTPTVAEGEGIKNLDEIIKLQIVNISSLGKGFLFHYKIKKSLD
ncbi:MAG: 2,5-diamino-6-(ribosylamino)-4(3H)-pyrimidinone 5'-phosphate reductase [Candidatus Thermoplasmatota archaeon]